MKNVRIFLLIILQFTLVKSQPGIGDLIWEDNFDNLDHWIISSGNGSWGWGNGELQFYSENNIAITEISSELGNNALHITAYQESGDGIVDQ